MRGGASRAPELDGAIDDRALIGALAAHAPADGVAAYLQRCHPGDLALAQAASRGHPAAIARIERTHAGMLDAICGHHMCPGHSAADLRQIVREKLYVAPRAGVQASRFTTVAILRRKPALEAALRHADEPGGLDQAVSARRSTEGRDWPEVRELRLVGLRPAQLLHRLQLHLPLRCPTRERLAALPE